MDDYSSATWLGKPNRDSRCCGALLLASEHASWIRQPACKSSYLFASDLPGGSWEVYSQDKRIDPSITLHDWPATLTSDALYEYLSLLDNLTTCNGNADQELMEIAVKRKGIFKAAKGKEVKARVDPIPFVSDGKPYSATIRTSECQILVKEGRCKACKVYRRTLLTMARQTENQQHDVTSTGSHTNWRFLSTTQKAERATKRAGEVRCTCDT